MKRHHDSILDEIRAALNVSLAPLPPTLRARPAAVRVRTPRQPGLLADIDRAGLML